MLRKVIVVKDDEDSVKQAIRDVLRAKHKGHEFALDLTRIKDKAKKTEIMKRLTRY